MQPFDKIHQIPWARMPRSTIKRIATRPMAKVLIVDDEPLIAMMLSDWLGEQNVETVGPAHSVAQALALLEESGVSGIDAAVLDVSLGDGNSYAIADALAAKGIPFAFATGHGANSIAERFKAAITVTKPFDFEVVSGVVTKLLDRVPQG